MFILRRLISIIRLTTSISFAFITLQVNSQQQKASVNLMEKLKPVGIPVIGFEGEPIVSLTGYNYKLAAFSNDLKYMAVSRSFMRKGSEIMDIVLIKLKGQKETVLLDTLAMVRYGRPNGILYDIYFNDQHQLIAKISDGMAGSSTLTFDPEKKELIKDEYEDEYYEDEGEMEEEILYEEKLADLKRIFPRQSAILLSDMVYKMREVDTVGYIVQGVLPNNNSIFYLPHGAGKLRLIHDVGDPSQIDNIDGVWGTRDKAFYLLKDKKNNYLFRYDIKANVVTLLEKFPLHSHFSYIYRYPLRNKDVLLAFEVEVNKPEANETLRLFKFSNGVLHKYEDYPFLQEVNYIEVHNLLLLFHIKDGKRCLDVREINTQLP